jgi:hypothetical protein
VKVNLLRPELPAPRARPKVYAFVAVHFDGDLLDDVAALAERLRGDARLSGATWSEPHALRATLHFFLHVVVLDLEDVGAAPYLTALQARAEAEAVALGAEPSTLVRPLFLKLARASTPVDVSAFADEGQDASPGLRIGHRAIARGAVT